MKQIARNPLVGRINSAARVTASVYPDICNAAGLPSATTLPTNSIATVLVYFFLSLFYKPVIYYYRLTAVYICNYYKDLHKYDFMVFWNLVYTSNIGFIDLAFVFDWDFLKRS